MKYLLPLFLVTCFSLKVSAGQPIDASPFFDKPTHIKRASLPADHINSKENHELSCFYFTGFFVKQIDFGERGAEQLSFIPMVDGYDEPPCQQYNVEHEKVIDSKNWNGWFKGVKGNYIFFDADDGLNGGMGFAVFDEKSGEKIIDDLATDMDAGTIFRNAELLTDGILLRYQRVYTASCSLRVDEGSCWQKIKHETGLQDASPPDCKSAYDREKVRTPKYASIIDSVPSVIDYQVELSIRSGRAEFTPQSSAKSCWIAD